MGVQIYISCITDILSTRTLLISTFFQNALVDVNDLFVVFYTSAASLLTLLGTLNTFSRITGYHRIKQCCQFEFQEWLLKLKT